MNMNTLLYGTVLAIWGSTWLAISYQSGEAPALTSVFFRFLLASAVMVLIAVVKGQLKRVAGRDLLFTFLQGLCLYSLNFICFYNGVKFISGGMESLIFSTAVLFNGAGASIFWKEPIPKGFVLSSAAGMSGLVLILMQDISLSGSESWI
jgi:drug/metabolite transporter (DMT)-like permease